MICNCFLVRLNPCSTLSHHHELQKHHARPCSAAATLLWNSPFATDILFHWNFPNSVSKVVQHAAFFISHYVPKAIVPIKVCKIFAPFFENIINHLHQIIILLQCFWIDTERWMELFGSIVSMTLLIQSVGLSTFMITPSINKWSSSTLTFPLITIGHYLQGSLTGEAHLQDYRILPLFITFFQNSPFLPNNCNAFSQHSQKLHFFYCFKP